MGKKYSQLSPEERNTLACLLKSGQSIRKIAAIMDRSASTISRELRRNSGSGSNQYKAGYADEIAWSRRWRGSRLERHPALRNEVLALLTMGWSPEQIAGRMNREKRSIKVSYESIYRFIYAQIKRTKDYSWRYYLPRSKSKRGFRGRKGGSSVMTIKDRVSIDERPHSVETRRSYGHWEADLMMNADKKQNLLVLYERKSRFIFIQWNRDKKAANIANTICKKLAKLPKQLRQTLTFDNGTEFAHHTQIRQKLGIQTYFCHPRKPWQKGGVENMNSRLRRYLPRRIQPDNIDKKEIQMLQDIINSTPRKCLGFKTPLEVFSKLLHFKCESTFLPSQE